MMRLKCNLINLWGALLLIRVSHFLEWILHSSPFFTFLLGERFIHSTHHLQVEGIRSTYYPHINQPVQYPNKMNNSQFMQTIDHITNRVTACTTTGLIIGASLATFKAMPLPQTTITMASSFALASTACFIPERIFYHASFYIKPRKWTPQDEDSDSNGLEKEDQIRLFASHGLGGAAGGGIVGGLFKGKPLPGIMMMTPIMLGVAYGELKLEEYKKKRIKELRLERAGN